MTPNGRTKTSISQYFDIRYEIMAVFLALVAPLGIDKPMALLVQCPSMITFTEKKHVNSLECVKYVRRVGVVSKVESHVRSCPSV